MAGTLLVPYLLSVLQPNPFSAGGTWRGAGRRALYRAVCSPNLARAPIDAYSTIIVACGSLDQDASGVLFSDDNEAGSLTDGPGTAGHAQSSALENTAASRNGSDGTRWSLGSPSRG